MWSLAGGIPPSPEGAIGVTPPLDAQGNPLLPGGDPVCFTKAIVGIVENLVFENEVYAQRLAAQLLSQAGDVRALRASEIFPRVARRDVVDLDSAVTCADCGAAATVS